MFDYKIKDNGDIDISSGDLQFTHTIKESLINRLKIRFNVWQEEWQFNLDFGTPYRQRLLGNTLNKDQKDAEITRVCYQDPDVKRVVSIESSEDPFDRVYNVHSVIVETIDGLETIPLYLKESDPYTYPEPKDPEDLLICQNGQLDFDAINRLYILMNNKLPETGEYTWWTASWR